MSYSRRLFVLQSSAFAVGLGGLRAASAQALRCPAGEVVVKRTITETVIYPEGGITIVGVGGSSKVPRKVVLETLECAPPPPPPPPPPAPPPKSIYWTPYDLINFVADRSITDGIDASEFYVATSLPGFAALNGSTASIGFLVRLANGLTVSSSHALARDGNGFRLANPAALDYWMSTTARDKVSTRWEVSGIGVNGLQVGSGTYGVAQYFKSAPISASSGFIEVKLGSTTGGTKVNLD